MRPMLASPASTPPEGDGWRHEVKWDGIRAIATVADGVCRLTTRSEKDCTAAFPEISGSHLADFDDLVLDGEIVSLVDGRPDFRAVMHRLAPAGPRGRVSKSADDAAHLAGGVVQFVVFDVLRAAGHDLRAMPWSTRRQLLEGAGIEDGAVIVPPVHTDAAALVEATKAQGIEGIVSKRVSSIYRPGVRSEEWLKFVHRLTESFVVVGWRPVTGSVGTLGAILIGERTDAGIEYRGRVGTGFSAASGRALLEWLTPAPQPLVLSARDIPTEDVTGTHWVRPEVMVDVEFLDRSAGGRLRQPSYKGLRLDLGA